MNFKLALDEIKNILPNVSKIHLFPAVQVGVSLAMGKHVSPTIHHTKEIQVYNYQGGIYIPCFILQSLEREALILEEAEIEQVSSLRKQLQDNLEHQIKPFLKSKTSGEKSWFECISENLNGSIFR